MIATLDVFTTDLSNYQNKI